MKKIIYTILLLFIVNYSSLINASLVIDGKSDFKRKVNANLFEAKSSSIYLAKLIQNIKNSSSTITIKPITNDQSTWHKSGKKSRSHTKALDSKSRSAERNTATNSIIFINTNRITKTHKTYNSGTLVHEIVHASDLANGKYHGNYPIREKRAVFFQNIWRNAHSKKLRTDYHGRFETTEYQDAKKAGKLKQFVNYYLTHSDIP
jgi:hypothetical protein